jgi:putative nucleotidyltransferase with HDIG domain
VINTPRHMSTRWAAKESQRLLRNEPVGRRLHSVSVGLKATCLARQLGRDGDVLIAAAYLHDIGYSYELRRTGFHPLDGAFHLRDRGLERLACLVAHHSSSEYAADLLGLTRQLRLFSCENSFLMDALTYCDMTTDLNGQEVSFDERLMDVSARYGRNHPVALALDSAEPSLRASMRRVEEWLASQSNLACGSLAR